MDETQSLLGLRMNILEDIPHAIFDEMVANNFFVGGQGQGWSTSISSSQSIELGAPELLAGVFHLFDVFNEVGQNCPFQTGPF